jgi:hypothetical protein
LRRILSRLANVAIGLPKFDLQESRRRREKQASVSFASFSTYSDSETSCCWQSSYWIRLTWLSSSASSCGFTRAYQQRYPLSSLWLRCILDSLFSQERLLGSKIKLVLYCLLTGPICHGWKCLEETNNELKNIKADTVSFCKYLGIFLSWWICGKLTVIYTRAQPVVKREMVHGSNPIK